MIILTSTSSVNGTARLFTVILIFIFVLLITYLTTKYVGSYQKMQSMNKNFEVIETYRVANNKFLQLVRIADKYVVIAIGKDEITKITEVDSSSLIVKENDKTVSSDTFASIIFKAKERLNNGAKNQDDENN